MTGQCHRQVGGKQLFAKLNMTIEPAPAEKTPQVLCLCSPDEVPPELTAAATEELRLCAEGGGPIGSFPLSGLKVTVTGGEIHLENSDETAFRIAAVDAFEKGLQAGGPVLLEPIMKLDITTPEEYLGDIVGDLQQRRALICSTQNRGMNVIIESHAPLRELLGYVNAIRSLSQGRASYSMEPYKYAPVPPEVARQYEM